MIKVLLVDDSKFIVRAMTDILQKMDFEVVAVAHDGQEGIEAFESSNPDVTLLDVTMPNMDGLDCLQRIREADPDARVVMVSAVHDPETIQRCLDAGASGFLNKPIRGSSPSDLSRLTDAIEEAAEKVA